MPDDLPMGLRVRDLETDLHCGPDLDKEAEKRAREEDEAYEKELERKLNNYD